MKTYPSIRKGFTLIELLVAMSITTVIIGVLVGATRMSMDAWKDSRDKARASRLAKESIEVMARDLEGVVIRSGNQYEWLYVKIDDSITVDDLGPDNKPEAKMLNPLEFTFLTAATDRYDGMIGNDKFDKGGDISTVIYRMVYKDQLGDDFKVYSLYRKLVDPDETFVKFLAQDSIQGKVESDLQEVTLGNNFIAENVYSMTVTLIFEYTEIDAENVSRIVQRRFPVQNVGPQGGTPTNSISVKGDKIVISPDPTPTLPADARLSGAELGILVLSDSGMRALNKKPFANPEAFAKFVKENSHYFTKSVVLPRP